MSRVEAARAVSPTPTFVVNISYGNAMSKKITQQDTTAVFQRKAVRRTLHNDEWWFVITDIVAALTNAVDPSDYWKRMRRCDPALRLDSQGGGQIDPALALDFKTAGGWQKIKCWNTQGIFRLIQSIPSPKAVPFKSWLAKVGKERLDEIVNPELAMGRMQELYKKKGYTKKWIDKRMRGIAVRQDLVGEWKARGVASRVEFAILTNEIMQDTLDLKVGEYKQVKSLAPENLHVRITDIEFVLTMLGGVMTTKRHRDRDSQGIASLKKAAKDGGAVAGRRRKDVKQKSGKPVVRRSNYLPPPADGAVLKK